MSEEIRAFADALRGDATPLSRFGVSIYPIPWWRKRIQRYVTPRRFKLWCQVQVLAALEEE